MKHERASLPTPNSTNSFWHSEPNEFLLGHRTSPELPGEADIVIVGSGITGTSAARYLVEDKRANGKSIVLLEAREACWGATGRVGAPHQVILSATVLWDSVVESTSMMSVKYSLIETLTEWWTLPTSPLRPQLRRSQVRAQERCRSTILRPGQQRRVRLARCHRMPHFLD